MSSKFVLAKAEGNILNSRIVFFRGLYGVTINGDDVNEILHFAMEHLVGDFGVISDRIFEFDIEPLSFYKAVNAVHQLQTIAIVSYRTATTTVANIEKGLCRKPFAIFDSMEKAEQWLEEQLGSGN